MRALPFAFWKSAQALTRGSTGLLLEEDFSTLWSSTGGWSSVASPAPVTFGRLNYTIHGPGATDDKTGNREFQAVRLADGSYVACYDGSNGTTGFVQQYGTSANKLRTINRLGPTAAGYTKVGGGTYFGTAMGWYEIRGGSHILRRVTSDTEYSGIPTLLGQPYGGDVYEGTDLGNLTGVRTDFPTSDDRLPSCVVLFEGVYYHYIQHDAAVEIYTSTTPTGALTATGNSLPVAAYPEENPKVFWHPTFEKWVCLVNLITDAIQTQANAAYVFDNIADPTNVEIHYIQKAGPLDGIRQTGVPCHITGEDGVLVWDSVRKVVPITYDEGTENTGNHEYRRISAALLEASAHCARFNSVGSGRISKTVAHSDFVADFIVKFRNTDAAAKVAFGYRQDGSGNGYRVVMTNATSLVLEKIVGGSTTTIQTVTTGQLVDDLSMYRIKVVSSGASHEVFVNGFPQIVATDSAHASGTVIAFDGDGAYADIRLPRARTSDTLTLSGLEPGATVLLRATSVGIPAATGYADDTGTARIASNVWPLDSVEIDGTEYSLASSAPFYGGDALAFAGTSTAGYAPEADANLVLQFDASQEALEDQAVPSTVTDFSPSESHITQATAGSRPRFDKRVQNGLPGFYFDGGDYLSNATFAGLNGATQAAWLIVFRTDYDASPSIPFATAGQQALLQLNGYQPLAYANSGNYGGPAAFPVFKSRVISVAFDGTQTGDANRLKMWIDGVQQTLGFTGSIPASLNSTLGVTLGALTGGILNLKGYVFEVLARTGLPDMAQFNAYAINKWGVRPI